MNPEDLTESEKAALRAEMLGKLSKHQTECAKARAEEAGQNNSKATPLKETIQQPGLSSATYREPEDFNRFKLPTLEEGLAHRLGMEEARGQVSSEKRKEVIEKTQRKFNQVLFDL